MIEDGIRRFIVEELHWSGSSESLADDYPLIEERVLDSLGIFRLVSFVEAQFGIEIEDEELVPENFGTIQSIVKLVMSRA